MNLERLLMQVFRMASRRLINRGVNSAIGHVARGGRQPDDMTPEQKAQAKAARQAAQRARQAAKLMRRIR